MIVYVQHFKNSTNPIHISLHKSMAERGLKIRYFEFVFLPIRPGIVYIHFPNSCVTAASVWKMFVKFSAFMVSILWARLTGSRIVWEVNNVRSHEHRFPLFEAILMAVFIRSVSGVIHYSISSARETINIYPALERVPWIVIPHPNFRHIYQKRGDAARGRKILEVNEGEIVLLAFGLIRRYKGTKQLIELFKKIEGTRLRLVIAGRPINQAYAAELQLAAQPDSRVRLIFREIPHAEVPDIYAVTTLHCAPFRAILNSGSVILALSLACPVIAPRLGSLQDLEERVGKEWITLYDGELDLPIMRKAIRWACEPRSSEPALGFCDIEKVTTDTLTFLTRIRYTRSSVGGVQI